MKTAPNPDNEMERLATLRCYDILDTPAEPVFDELTGLAAQVCGTPLALITLVDHDRQWVKSSYGCDLRQTPRSESICAHTLLASDLLEVPDLEEDERFRGHPWVWHEPRVRSYAGTPLRSPEGHALGTLCVLHRQSHVLRPDQQQALRILGRQVMAQMELRRRLSELDRTLAQHRQIEQRLHDSESFYQMLVETLPQNIIRKDAQGRFTFANRRFCESISRPLEELLGKTDFDLYPTTLASKYHRDDLRVMATREHLDTVEAHQTAQGEKLFVHVIKTPLYDAQGQIVGIQGIFWDVTQRRKIEEALAYERDLLQALLENIPDRIYFKDVHSRFLRCSLSMALRLGVSDPKQVIGKTDFDFHPRALAQEFFNDEQRIILTGRPLINKLEKQTDSTGEEIWASVTKVPIYNRSGAVAGIIGISRDVTQLKKTEQALEKARDAALESARAKSQFLANMSHEIRTPMNAITGMTGLLRCTPLNSEQQEYVDTITVSTSTLLAIINEILDFSRLEAGKVQLETIDFDLPELIESTTNVMAVLAQQKALELCCWIDRRVPTHVRGAPSRIRQVLTNLLSNAVKFTERGEVVVRVTLLDESETTANVRVAVHDTGIGITPEAITQIFEAFTQADGSTTRRFGGTGLGLTISKHLVELMDGRIAVESQPHQGSIFWFELPFAKALPASAAALDLSTTELPQLAGMHILVVEGSTTARQILLDVLSGWNLHPLGAATYDEATRRFREATQKGHPPEYVLVDLEMDSENGLEFASSLARPSAIPAPRVVAITSYGAHVTVDEMRAAGIRGRLHKPVRQSRLRECLKRVLQETQVDAFESGEPSAQPLVLPMAVAATSRPVRILLAEDNPVNQRVVLSQLKKLGYTADAVPDGREVLEAMKRKAYDVLLLDCQMPEVDGYEVSRRLREAGQSTATPFRSSPYIIALTANSLFGDRERCLEAGMNDYLTKPIDVVELGQCLQRALQSLPSQEAEPLTETKTFPVLDRTVIDGLRQLSSPEDPDPLAGLIALFIQDAGNRLEKMEHAFAQGDAASLAAAAHAVKGSANNLGARQLGALCGRLEKIAKAGNLEAAGRVLKAVRTAFQTVEAALRHEAGHNPATS